MKHRIFLLLAAGLLVACASSTPPLGNTQGLFADALFAPSNRPVRSEEIFAVSPEMQGFLDSRVAENVAAYGGQRGLYEAVNDELKLDYDASMTKTAAQSFASRSGNCLSLVLLSAAFAKQLGLPVRYQSVFGFDTWTRSGGMAFLSTHINLALGPHHAHTLLGDEPENSLTIDFLPARDVAHQHSLPLEENTVVAMYFNNRAAEVLAAGQIDEAYWLARQAIARAPAFTAAYNTLAVIYLRHGNAAEAEQALNFALQREPDNPLMLSNLAEALMAEGRAPEAERLLQRLARIENYQPYHFYDLGMSALARGDAEAAVNFFKKELAQRPYDDQLHLAAALAYQRLGKRRAAERQLELALENSSTRENSGIYAAKLARLRAERTR